MIVLRDSTAPDYGQQPVRKFTSALVANCATVVEDIPLTESTLMIRFTTISQSDSFQVDEIEVQAM
jgi:hypothetical protein